MTEYSYDSNSVGVFMHVMSKEKENNRDVRENFFVCPWHKSFAESGSSDWILEEYFFNFFTSS